MAPRVITFGCRLNALESEVMRGRAAAAGLNNAILVNTCAVTGEAVRQARQAIRKARRENPDATIVVSGCAAQIDPRSFAEIDGVDLVLGNAEKLSSEAYGGADFGLADSPTIRVNDIMSVEETAGHLIDGMDGRARAFVEVQNGCDPRCTLCIIPYGRGNSRSVPMGAVVEQVERLVDNGYREVVLTGVDITCYGADLPGRPRLGRLVRAILKHVRALDRLRLSAIDSIEVDDDLFAAVAEEERLMPHLPLSLQHGDDLILKRMKRRHSRDDTIRFAQTVRRLRPDMVFGADLIAGFPTETEAMFANALSIVDDCDLTYLHVFPFSPREGTPAARMPQLEPTVIRARAARLRAAGDKARGVRFAKEIGTIRQVLIERPGLGRTEHFAPVTVPTDQAGDILSVRIDGHSDQTLIGEPLAEAA